MKESKSANNKIISYTSRGRFIRKKNNNNYKDGSKKNPSRPARSSSGANADDTLGKGGRGITGLYIN